LRGWGVYEFHFFENQRIGIFRPAYAATYSSISGVFAVYFTLGPEMRNAIWLIAVMLNSLIAVAFTLSLAHPSTQSTPISWLICGPVIVLSSATAVLFLVLARFKQHQHWHSAAMRCVCASLPVLWLFGSLDYGMVTVQEIIVSCIVALISLGTWRAFKIFLAG
jgi:hypothetical protein